MQQQDVADLRENLARGQMTTQQITEIANELLKNNELEQALPVISLLAEDAQASIQTLMTAGMVALSLQKKDEAIRFFEQVVQKDANNFDANYNLVLLGLEEGNTEAAVERLQRLIELNPQNASLYSDLAVICVDRGDVKSAFEYWQKALSIDPNLAIARDNAMEICLEKNMVQEGKHLLMLNAKTSGLTSGSVKQIERWAHQLAGLEKTDTTEVVSITEKSAPTEIRGKKIAVFAGIDSFVREINTHLSANNELKVFSGGTVDEMRRLMQWADIAWFEWCDNFIIEATKLPKTCQIVCRLHSYEAFTDMPARVDWEKVDLLIFVNDSVRNIVKKQFPISTPSVVIHNAVDGNRFDIPQNKAYGKKIASVGYINYKKNPTLLLYCFKKIHEYDPEYSLHIAGQHQDSRIQMYFDHFLKENPLPVHFDGWVEDMPGWYEDKDFVISTSLFESFHYSIAEGMACGVMPLIHNWYGAKNIYPERFLFNDPDSCLGLLRNLEHSDRRELARTNREYILGRYDINDKLQAIGRELAKVVTEDKVLESVR